MRRLHLTLLFSLPALAACQPAAAASNREMAQCIAAFHFGRQVWLSQSPPNYQALAPLTAGSIYYANKLKAAGVADGGKADAIAFAERHADDAPLMAETLKACGQRQIADPDFVRQFVALTRQAILVDAACKPDPGRCQKRR